MSYFLKITGNKLLEATKKCRYDMHEPDEQGVHAYITGKDLDNATGDSGTRGELTIVLCVSEEKSVTTYNLNLATVLALARIGAKTLRD